MFQAQVSSQMNAAAQISSSCTTWSRSTAQLSPINPQTHEKNTALLFYNLLSFAVAYNTELVTETTCRQSVFVVLAVFSSRGM